MLTVGRTTLLFLAVLAAAMFASLIVFAPQAKAATSTKNGFTLTKKVSPQPGTVGKPLTFTITETNVSGVPFTAVRGINDVLPSSVKFVSATPPPGGTCSYNSSTRTVNCKNFFLATGSTVTMKVVVIPQKPGTFTNVANDSSFPGNVVREPFKVITAPVAKPDVYTAIEDHNLTKSAAQGVLKNDTGTRPLTAKLVSKPKHGTLALRANGAFVYKPQHNFFGKDTFTYRDVNRAGASKAATVTINVKPRPK